MRIRTPVNLWRIVFLFSLSAISYCHAKNKLECFIRPKGDQHSWGLEEPLKIDFFIPPRWGQKNEHLNISINGKINYLLTARPKTGNVGITRFINFPKEHIPKAGWTSILLFYRNASIQIEGKNENPFIIENEPQNPPWLRFSVINVTAKGMYAVINCDSNLRTFFVEEKASHNMNKMNIIGKLIPVTFHKNVSQIGLFGNQNSEVQLLHEKGSGHICMESDDPNANILTLKQNYEPKCQLPLKKTPYFLTFSVSLVNQQIERNEDTAVGYVRIFPQNSIYVQTMAIFNGSLQKDNTKDTINEIPAVEQSSASGFSEVLIVVCAILSLILLAGIVAIVLHRLRQKARTSQEQLTSSASWTQKNFDSINTTELYIRNEVYEQSYTRGDKKFSASSNYSSPVDDEEYEEPTYQEGRDSVYDTIYQPTYADPFPQQMPTAESDRK